MSTISTSKQCRINDCIVNFQNEIHDTKCAISSAYYRFKDERGHTFPVDMTESTYKFIADRVKYMVLEKRGKINVNQNFGKELKHIRIKSVVCNDTLPIQYNDKNFHIIVFDENKRVEHKLYLADKDRVVHPNRNSYLCEQQKALYKRKNGRSVTVNKLSQTVQAPAPCIQNGVEIPLKNTTPTPTPTPVSTNSENSLYEDFCKKVLNIKTEYADDLKLEIMVQEEEIENLRKEIEKINQQISDKQKKINEINAVLKRIEIVEISMSQN